MAGEGQLVIPLRRGKEVGNVNRRQRASDLRTCNTSPSLQLFSFPPLASGTPFLKNKGCKCILAENDCYKLLVFAASDVLLTSHAFTNNGPLPSYQNYRLMMAYVSFS